MSSKCNAGSSASALGYELLPVRQVLSSKSSLSTCFLVKITSVRGSESERIAKKSHHFQWFDLSLITIDLVVYFIYCTNMHKHAHTHTHTHKHTHTHTNTHPHALSTQMKGTKTRRSQLKHILFLCAKLKVDLTFVDQQKVIAH